MTNFPDRASISMGAFSVREGDGVPKGQQMVKGEFKCNGKNYEVSFNCKTGSDRGELEQKFKGIVKDLVNSDTLPKRSGSSREDLPATDLSILSPKRDLQKYFSSVESQNWKFPGGGC